MTKESRKYIKEVIERLSKIDKLEEVEINRDWVLGLLSSFRQHLEDTKQNNKYKILNFYCNWYLHTNLDRGIVQEFIDNISFVINNDKAGHPADRISEILSMSELRAEIKKILSKENYTSNLFEVKQNWIIFTELMILSLLEKPLNRTRNLSTKYAHYIESLWLGNNSGKLFWYIKVMPDDLEFKGPLVRTES